MRNRSVLLPSTMAVRARHVSVLLCLLLRRVLSDFVVEDLHLVDGLINQHITLPCSFTIPDNWRHQDIHITWYKDFTIKFLDCSVKGGVTPLCQENPDSSRVHLRWKFPGNADLHIYSLQESDEGHYQCWIIFNDAYQRQDSLLRVHTDENGTRREVSFSRGVADWQTIAMVSAWNVLLLSGWPIFLLLAGILLSQKYQHHRRRNFFIISPAKTYDEL